MTSQELRGGEAITFVTLCTNLKYNSILVQQRAKVLNIGSNLCDIIMNCPLPVLLLLSFEHSSCFLISKQLT